MSHYPSRGSSADPLRLSRQALNSRGAKIKLTITHKNERLPVTPLYRNHQHPHSSNQWPTSVQMWDSHFQALCTHAPFQLLYAWCIFSLDREDNECYAVNMQNFHTGAHTSMRSRDQKKRKKEEWGSLWLSAKDYEVVSRHEQVLVVHCPSNPDDFMLKVFSDSFD